MSHVSCLMSHVLSCASAHFIPLNNIGSVALAFVKSLAPCVTKVCKSLMVLNFLALISLIIISRAALAILVAHWIFIALISSATFWICASEYFISLFCFLQYKSYINLIFILWFWSIFHQPLWEMIFPGARTCILDAVLLSEKFSISQAGSK